MLNPPILTYRACRHGIPTFLMSRRDLKEEAERAAKGEVCPKCRAEQHTEQEKRR
jgi:hypothetical protein